MRSAVLFTRSTNLKNKQSQKLILFQFIGCAKVDRLVLKVRKACGVGEFCIEFYDYFKL